MRISAPIAVQFINFDSGWGTPSLSIIDRDMSNALYAQQQLAKESLKIMHPTADGRLRVSKRKLTALFSKIGVEV